MYTGIDYGLGQTNIDKATGIRYGVISVHDITQAWYDTAEADYGPPTCPKCQGEADDPTSFGDSFADGKPDDYTDEYHECHDYVCENCKHFFGSESAFGGEPVAWALDDGEYKATDCLDSDVMILASPFYTFAPFCSPCVPGAGNLNDAIPPATAGHDTADLVPRGVRSYCFGHDWFDSGKAPYRVFCVDDDTEVFL